MVGMLQDRTADVAVAPLSITHIRSFAIDFTIPVQMVRLVTIIIIDTYMTSSILIPLH